LSDNSGGTTIDGRTQSNIEVQGTAAALDGIKMSSSNNVVRTVTVNSFTAGGGVRITGNNNTVRGCKIGTDPTGTIRRANTNGVLINAANNNLIGVAGDGNIISGNTTDGIQIAGGAHNNSIQINYIGLNANGACGIGNGGNGVFVNASPNNFIGGGVVAARNIISCNGANGVSISGAAASGNLVQGNYIGLNPTALIARPNAGDGVDINGAPTNTVGGGAASPGAAPGNYISANTGDGVFITGAGASGNTALGNVIGLDSVGGARGNGANGVWVVDASRNMIGGSGVTSRNIISANGNDGVLISYVTVPAASNLVQGNYIGLDFGGNLRRGNGAQGVEILAPNNTVGGSTATPGNPPGNYISANGLDGVLITTFGATSNAVLGNVIGLDINGLLGVGNGLNGVEIHVAPTNTIGGASVTSRNVISGNTNNGVHVSANNNLVQGNYIGLEPGGTLARANRGQGVEIKDGSKNQVGGNSSPAGAPPGNYISANRVDGVLIDVTEFGSFSNTVLGNVVGLGVNGASLGNGGEGVEIVAGATNASGNTIGGSVSQARNIISANAINGVRIGNGAASNSVYGNYIGLDATGASSKGNGANGVFIDAATNNNIGDVAQGNIISANGNDGVLISGTGATNNTVRSNRIGTDQAGAQARGNAGGGVVVNLGAGLNMVGDPNPAGGNLISGNPQDGILINGGAYNQILNNTIGPDAGRSVSLAPGNGKTGVHVTGAPLNVVSNNVVEGNQAQGILVEGASQTTLANNFVGSSSLPNHSHGIHIQTTPAVASVGNTVRLNLIGNNIGDGLRLEGVAPDLTRGTVVLANNIIGQVPNAGAGSAGSGISLIGNVQSNSIGGLVFGTGNIMGGNAGNGIEIRLGGGGEVPTGNTISQNYIGLNSAGNAASPNLLSGVFIAGGTANTVGPGNVISANTLNGITLAGPPAGGNPVQGNLIGLDASGSFALGNQLNGVFVSNVPNVLIGGTAAGLRNVVSGNLSNGISLVGAGTSGNLVQGNFIGTGADGSAAVANQGDGINLADAPNNTLGGTTAAAANTLSGNRGNGITIAGAAAVNNLVQGNRIGTDPGGFLAVPNQGAGVFINASSNSVGGLSTTPGTAPGNAIRGNQNAGVILDGGPGGLFGRNLIQGNRVELNTAGGLLINNSSDNTVGGVPLGAFNTFNQNGGDGVQSTGFRNVFAGNSVLLNSGNGFHLIGSTNVLTANAVLSNALVGVLLTGPNSVANAISQNGIYTNGGLGIDLGGNAAPDGVTLNDGGDADVGANQLQNFPMLLTVTNSGGNVTLQGTLNSRPSASYQLEFFCSATCDASGYGEGQTYLGAAPVVTDGAGNASFSVNLAWAGAGCDFFTATATDGSGNTSEFSPCLQLSQSTVLLSLSASNTLFTLSWPSSASGFQLETTTSLLAPILWQLITNGISDDGTLKTYNFTNDLSSTNRFFRLQQF
jgi:parallel beta-helix repeat protein